jgi:hypothetical protein
MNSIESTIENLRQRASYELDNRCEELTGEEGEYHRDPRFAALLREEIRDLGWRTLTRDLPDSETVEVEIRRYVEGGEVEGIRAKAKREEADHWPNPIAWARVGALLHLYNVWSEKNAQKIEESDPLTQRLPNF